MSLLHQWVDLLLKEAFDWLVLPPLEQRILPVTPNQIINSILHCPLHVSYLILVLLDFDTRDLSQLPVHLSKSLQSEHLLAQLKQLVKCLRKQLELRGTGLGKYRQLRMLGKK